MQSSIAKIVKFPFQENAFANVQELNGKISFATCILFVCVENLTTEFILNIAFFMTSIYPDKQQYLDMDDNKISNKTDEKLSTISSVNTFTQNARFNGMI